jgi:hypothetical protein
MENFSVRQYGVSQPVSLAGPSVQDEKLTGSLVDVLKLNGMDNCTICFLILKPVLHKIRLVRICGGRYQARVHSCRTERYYPGMGSSSVRKQGMPKFTNPMWLYSHPFSRSPSVQGIESSSEGFARLFTFGSYKLGTSGSGADVDTVVVCCRHIDSEDFFVGLGEGLLSHVQDITKITVRAIRSSICCVYLLRGCSL